LEVQLKLLEKRISELEEKIPNTFDIFYRPPGWIGHVKLNLALDDLYAKINRLEDHFNENGTPGEHR
jgi:ribosomal protein S15P/S13E